MEATTWYVRAMALTVVATAATGFVAAFGIGFAGTADEPDIGLWIFAGAVLVEIFALIAAGSYYFKGVSLQHEEKTQGTQAQRPAGRSAEQFTPREPSEKDKRTEILVGVGVALAVVVLLGALFLQSGSG